MGLVAHIRSQLGIPTIFNILGPLINPIPIQSRILGVYSEKLGESYALAASILAKQSDVHVKTMVVFGEVVLDEISPIGTTKTWTIDSEGTITREVYLLLILDFQNMSWPLSSQAHHWRMPKC